MVGESSAIGNWFERMLGYSSRLERTHRYSGRMEATVLLEEPEAFDANTIQGDEVTGKSEAERPLPRLTMFTEGSPLDCGATGYAVTWKNW
jgi:hypothetical protein